MSHTRSTFLINPFVYIRELENIAESLYKSCVVGVMSCVVGKVVGCQNVLNRLYLVYVECFDICGNILVLRTVYVVKVSASRKNLRNLRGNELNINGRFNFLKDF